MEKKKKESQDYKVRTVSVHRKCSEHVLRATRILIVEATARK